MLAQLAPAWVSASTAATSSKNSNPSGDIILIIVVVFAVILIFNVRRRSRKLHAEQGAPDEIAIGSTIVTRAGLIATLIDRNEDYVVLQLDDGTRARYVPQAVARVWMEPEHDLDPDDAWDPVSENNPDTDPDPETPTSGGPLSD